MSWMVFSAIFLAHQVKQVKKSVLHDIIRIIREEKMASLDTMYMGIRLSSPVIIASSPLTSNIGNLEKCEKAGAGAVVLKSLFEEQVEKEASREHDEASDYLTHSDSDLYFQSMAKDYYIDKYMELLMEAKKKLSIPVIASINCNSINTWIDYADRFISCGADAIELNYYPIASDSSVSGEKVDRNLFEFAKTARKRISCPLSLKIGSRYSSLSHVIKKLDETGINALVLFNRAFRPDIDLENLGFTHTNPLSSSEEYAETLRWTALMSAEVGLDIAANTGIHDASSAVKMILAGAKAVEICSVVIKNGFDAISEMNDGIRSFMDRKGYSHISDFTALLAQENREDGDAWERVQFLKTIK